MNKKIVGAIIAVIILVGLILTFTMGLNFDLIYRQHKEIDINLKQEFENKDIKEIAKEVLDGKEVVVRKVELYKDMVSIAVEDISDEQLQNLNTKLNEKYGLNNEVEDLIIIDIPNEKGMDIIKPYIGPTILSFVLIEVYLLIYLVIYKRKENEVNIIKAMFEYLCGSAIIELLYLSVLAITRLPINRLTIPIAMILFIGTAILKFRNNKQD